MNKKQSIHILFLKHVVYVACFFENRYPYVNEVMVYIKTILYIINGRIEIEPP